jgi:hypothetical protein
MDVISGGHGTGTGEHQAFDEMLSKRWKRENRQNLLKRNSAKTVRQSFILAKHTAADDSGTRTARRRSDMPGALGGAGRSMTSRHDLMLVGAWEAEKGSTGQDEAAAVITRFMRYACSVHSGDFESYFLRTAAQTIFSSVNSKRRLLFRPSQISVIEEMLQKADSNNSGGLCLSEFPGFVHDLETFLDGDQLTDLLKWLSTHKPAEGAPEEQDEIANEEFLRFLRTAKEPMDDLDEFRQEVSAMDYAYYAYTRIMLTPILSHPAYTLSPTLPAPCSLSLSFIHPLSHSTPKHASPQTRCSRAICLVS